ncbi:quinol:cytochrome c oxidoreductase iron-sulfur protein precursor [Pseudarcicella hirudinis]|uniref:Quinol:cytochrome c oxidoreductase iron-sulfur protein n=1 Tax=Pseudarcicella hirudinis TaxID=1079859 RepID=A0A1I5WM72_9BACT|nr:TAT-variant-translocated molybdopterin oxidoreductase [Pseudarcicella hirudinis]SFQ20687.1 quinol:cytochrome c oxidoreductase iron-sulfur protein precursor [Pseudarcicella hirudinis]
MENTTKRYWRGIEELTNDADFVKNIHNEFGSKPSENDYKGESLVDGTSTHRRDFLKVLGFGVAAVSLAACEAPVKNTIPYLNKPEDVEPTIASWYASTFTDGGDYASVLVKTREGRPIKLEVNPSSSLTKGLSARVHASVLSLYDNEKLKGAQVSGKASDWASADKAIIAELGRIAAQGGQIRIVSNTILSPTTKKVIADFITKYPTTKHVTYDANSASGLIQANGGVLPSFDFSKAKTIVSIGADFLGTWLGSDDYAAQWAKGRRVSSAKGGNKEMSRHYQFETIMSMTGGNADYRSAYKPSQEGLVVTSLYNAVAHKLGAAPVSAPSVKIDHLDKAAADLVASKGAALVVSGSNDPEVQKVVVAINALLGSYGVTIDLAASTNYRQGNDAEMASFISEAKAGQIAGVIFYNANPVYNHPLGAELAEALPKVALSISTNDRADETGSLCKYNTPDSHYLESWNDAEPKKGYYSLTQPTISTIFKTRQTQSSLLVWAGLNGDYASYLESNWKTNLLKGGKLAWSNALHDGVFEPAGIASSSAVPAVDLADASAKIAAAYKPSDKLELAIYEKVIMGTGSQANNPWLQECPEPISKACWDNYATVSLATAKKLNFEGEVELDTQEVEVSVNGKSVKLPLLIQPGQANDTIAIAIGYGRTAAGKSANGVGVNAYPFITKVNNTLAFFNTGDVQIKLTGKDRKLARTQTHNTVMAREAVVQETVLAEYQKNVLAGRFRPEITTAEGKKSAMDISIWNGHKYNNHAWGMVIDLNTCTGCSSCIVSCSAENNVAVVGRQEVVNRREMHWMRIDRYYSSDASVDDLKGLEHASENPEVVFQPMMCQHCNNAPCETVCPVLATTHSSEGLNQMTYNRCIGTRYCANNCPYKVRRFNWFRYYQTDDYDFHFNNDLGRMVINPDVTVRSRGVMEKCSMCVQRIQAGKLEAKKEKRRPGPNEIQTACSQSCPTNAITFGDMNDPSSEISKLLEVEREGRAFGVIEEINIKPNVSYLVKIRNKEKEAKKEEAKVEHKEHA